MGEEVKLAWHAIIAAGVFGGILGSVLTVFFNHRLTAWREKRSAISAERRKIMPLIEGYIVGASKGEGLGSIRYDAQQKLFQPAISFQQCLTGKRLERFNTAWQAFYNTTRTEVGNAQPNTPRDQNEKAKTILLSRLNELKAAVLEA